ncbi:MAG TPA: molybdopterin oxidoreductase family protein [Burkholderiaceae bacterium]|nr:molybdopterin oxidoreductase family protein [Burkholderiaceae bacterium]
METSANSIADTETIVRAACPHDCPDTCAMLVTVRQEQGPGERTAAPSSSRGQSGGGRAATGRAPIRVAVKVVGDPTHPTTAGTLCTKVSRYLERTYHPDRLLHPMKRVGAKGEGRFIRVSWDEALRDIAHRLREIANRDPQGIVPYSYAGTMGLVQGEGMAARFFHKLGASFLDRTICATAGAEALTYTIGTRTGTDIEQFQNSKLIVFWGCNAIASNLHLWSRAQEAKRRGAKLIAIDPYRSLTAEKCHQHIALMPGTDAAFALGVMHVLMREGWLDRDYIERYTLGYEELERRAEEFDPARVASICGISAAEIEDFARDYWQIRPAAIRLNYGMQRARGGGNAVRAVACLPALAGHWRDAAGGVLLSTSGVYPVDIAALQRPDLLAGKTPRTINMSTIGRDLQRANPPIEALIVYNSNPMAVAPQSREVARGFAREDLFTVVLEHFMTDTADYADYVLPATTQLEHVDVHRSYGHLYMLANNASIEPLGEALPNSEIFRRLAAAMGFDEPCFAETDDQIAAQAFKREGPAASFDWVRLKQTGWQRLDVPEKYAPFAQGAFATPSGRCEFYSEQVARLGQDPLPAYISPYEAPDGGELARRYPLAIISPPARHFLNSTFVNVTSLRSIDGEPTVEIHPRDALARGVVDGGRARVFNERGSIDVLARVTDRARPGCVVALSIWWKKLARDGKNANELTSDRLTDIGRAPTFYDCLVDIAPQ